MVTFQCSPWVRRHYPSRPFRPSRMQAGMVVKCSVSPSSNAHDARHRSAWECGLVARDTVTPRTVHVVRFVWLLHPYRRLQYSRKPFTHTLVRLFNTVGRFPTVNSPVFVVPRGSRHAMWARLGSRLYVPS